jgi:phosphohistidine phosphatase
MELYFLRHGLAGRNGDPQYKDDSLRPLTDEGRKKLQRAVRGMKALELAFDAVLSSPYVRARQTAEVAAEGYKIKDIHLTKNLLPPATAKSLVQEINKLFPRAGRVLAVGHEPHMTAMMSELLQSPRPLAIDFKKGGLSCLTLIEGAAVLNWILTPTHLSLLKPD